MSPFVPPPHPSVKQRADGAWTCSLPDYLAVIRESTTPHLHAPRALVEALIKDETPAPAGKWEDVHPVARAAALPYQREAVERSLAVGGRMLLALGPGLGKTIVACMISKACGGTLLVVSPSKKVSDWVRDLKRWSDVVATRCPNRTSDVGDAPIVVVGLGVVVDNLSIIKRRWDVVVVDESHDLMTAASKRSKVVCGLAKRASRSLFLTGTPQTAKPKEMWTTLDVMLEGKIGSQRYFETRYCEGFEGPMGWDANGMNPWLEDELFAIARLRMVRMTERDVDMGLPPLTTTRVDVDITNEDAAAIARMSEERDALRHRDPAVLKRMMDAATNAAKRAAGLAKLPSLFAWLDANLGTEKLAIFTSAIDGPTDRIVEHLKQRGIKHFVLNGTTTPARSDKFLSSFRTVGDETYQVGVCGIKSGGVGHDYSPGVSRVVMLELDWSTTTMEQASKRIHRLGCQRPCEVYVFVASRTMDAGVLGSLDKKARRNAAVVDGREADRRFDKRVRLALPHT